MVPQTLGLHVTMPDGSSFTASYDLESILIGSGPSSVLRLEDPGVSPIHAVIEVALDGVVTIIDLGSDAGTYVNGQAIAEPVIVNPGDSVTLGRVQIQVARGTVPKAHVLADDETTLENGINPKNAARAENRIDMSTQRIRERGNRDFDSTTESDRTQSGNTESDRTKGSGSSVIRASTDLDTSLLESPLPEGSRPTAEHRVLQIAVLWGDEIIDAVQVSEPRDITVGGRAARKCDLCVEGDLPVDSFTIATNQGGEASVIVPAAASVGLRRADGSVTREVSLSATDAPFPARSYRLSLHERLAFKVGTLVFVVQYVRGDAEMGRGAVMDWYFPRVFAISALLHAFFVVAAFITPQLSSSLVDDLFKNENRFAQMILKAEEKDKKRKKLDLSGMKGGAKHKDEEGKFGKKDKPKKDALASKAGAPRVDAKKREEDRKIALNAGLLGILKGAGAAGAVSNVFGPGGLGTGINNAMGGLRGTEMGDAGGAGGLGTRGTGAGGGGNSLGIGGLGTHGHGRGTGGYGNIDLGGRGKGETRIVPGKTIIQGSLSKEEIGRVIRRNLARFKYCYEKQLNANPNLSGKIAVYFTIAPTGDVAQASIRETSMNDQTVESCVEKVMRSLKFPRPRGGGIVVVTYPFVFAST